MLQNLLKMPNIQWMTIDNQLIIINCITVPFEISYAELCLVMFWCLESETLTCYTQFIHADIRMTALHINSTLVNAATPSIT